ncbi:MAG: aldehyde dehydrogenase family protein, partial [Geobacteraceae bacterium]|nr:aldehyde dehydrogenase family protein [Geobacteraceae bacterium]
MQVRDRLYINGEWREAQGSGFIEVVNPANEQVIGRIPEGTAGDAAAAIAAARAAFPGWSATAREERAAYLTRLQQGLVARTEEIAVTISSEVGMPLRLSRRIQAGLPAAVVESFARLAVDYPFEERIGNSLIVREPVGVVACITPWNYPLHQVVAKVAPALAAGCTVVLKPSELAPLSAFILAEIIHGSGLPAGVFNLVTGTGEVVGEALASDPEVDLVSFTGSTRAGRRVAELAARTVKRVTLELGGKSAAVILEDADLAAAVKGTVAGCFINSGQTCNALTRMLVPEQLYQEAARLAVEAAAGYTVGDPFAEGTRLGPLVSAQQRERVKEYIRKGIAEGGELLCGGTEAPEGVESGYFVRPTLFGRVAPGMTIAREEIFGPVLSIISYRDEEEAVRIANDTSYGLGGAVWSGDGERAQRLARRLRAGQVDVNGGGFNILAPFGGCKQSGYGREMGR